MSNGLNKYLQAVAHELRGLEPEQRESELREMRGHLEAIVARLMEGGLSEEEAVEAACAQFGAARKVGRELEKAGAGREPWWRIVLAPLAGMACFAAFVNVQAPLFDALDKLLLPEPWYMAIAAPFHRAFCWATEWPTFLLIGAVTQLISPRWGVRLMLGLCAAMFIPQLPAVASMGGMEGVGMASVSLLVWVLGIRLGSRWASRLSQRRADAQRA